MSRKTDYNKTKERILNHAAYIFQEYGYSNTTIRMIAHQAEVNVALINYHYGDKETLYLEVVRFWANDAFQNYPFEFLDDPNTEPEEKVRCFIYCTLVCLFGPEGKGTGFGRLLAHEAAISPSGVVQEIVSETIARPTKALSAAVAQISGIQDADMLRTCTACIVGQAVYFYLSRNVTGELFGLPQIKNDADIRELSDKIYAISMASLRHLHETK